VLNEVSGIRQAGQAGIGAVCIGGLSVDEGGDSNDGSDKVADFCDALKLGDQSIDVGIRCSALPFGFRPNDLEKVRNESSAGPFAVLKFRARNLTCPPLRRGVEYPVSGKKVRPESFPPILVARLFTVKSRRGSGKSAHRFRAWLTFLEIGKLASCPRGAEVCALNWQGHCSHCGNIPGHGVGGGDPSFDEK